MKSLKVSISVFRNSHISKCHNFTISNIDMSFCLVYTHSTILKRPDSHICRNIYIYIYIDTFENCLGIVLDVFKYFGNKQKLKGPDLVGIWKVPEMSNILLESIPKP